MLHNSIMALLQPLNVIFPEGKSPIFTCQGIDICIEADVSGEGMYLFYCVGVWPKVPSSSLAENILKANFFGSMTKGGHLGLYEERNALVYSLRLDVATLDVHTLQNALQLFATTALELVQQIADWQGDAALSESHGNAIDTMPFKGLRV